MNHRDDSDDAILRYRDEIDDVANISSEDTISGWDVTAELAWEEDGNRRHPSDEETAADHIESIHNKIHQCIAEQDLTMALAEITEDLICIIVESSRALNPEDASRKAWDEVIASNRALMVKKNKVYGSAWALMRPVGLLDIMHVKVHRIEEILSGADNDFEGVKDSLQDILNYAIFTIMKIEMVEGELQVSTRGSMRRTRCAQTNGPRTLRHKSMI